MIVKDDQIVGEGATEPRPGKHAEAIALNQAGERARGATIYCTLEPHAFQGVAAPCTDLIISAGIQKVVCPIEDPNPQVSGNGFRQLKAVGIEIDRSVSPKQLVQSNQLIEGFAHHLEHDIPFVTLKSAISLDGKIATRTGDSQWITSEASRERVHKLRNESDAILTGIGTVLADDPQMTARPGGSKTDRPKYRIVLDSKARLPESANILDDSGEIIWVVGSGANVGFERSNVSVLSIDETDDGLNLQQLLVDLGKLEIQNLLVEAGGKLGGSFLDQKLAQKVMLFIAPIIIGGEAAPGPFQGSGAAKLNDALRLETVSHERIGSDILIQGYVS